MQAEVYYSWVALGHWATRVVSPTIQFVADVLELTVGASAGAAVVVTTDGCH